MLPHSHNHVPFALIQDLQNVLSPTCLGDAISERPYLVDLALSILTLAVPKYWLEQVGTSAPPGDWPLKDWVRDLVKRYSFMDRVLTGGLARSPTFWLGGFFNPQAFLNVVQQVNNNSDPAHVISGDKTTPIAEHHQAMLLPIWTSRTGHVCCRPHCKGQRPCRCPLIPSPTYVTGLYAS